MPPFTIQPLRLPRLLCSLPGTHHSSFPLLPSSSCHLIQITELDSVSFVWGSILPGRWTGGEEMDSNRRECVCVCVCVCLWDGRRERKGGGERLKLFWEAKCQTAMKWGDFYLSNLCEVLPFRLLSDKAAVKREPRCESEGDRMSLPLIQLACHTVSALSVYALFYLTQCVISKKVFLVFLNNFKSQKLIIHSKYAAK